jgi:aminoglycoside 6'-N-acetyltransferase I
MDIWLAQPDTTVLVVPRVGNAGPADNADEMDAAHEMDPADGMDRVDGMGRADEIGDAAGKQGAGHGGHGCLLAGFAEVGTRSVAESCETSPVAYLEGWYVDPDMRRQGIGAALVGAAEDWSRARGFRELASDTQLTNITSQRAHEALGFAEVERSVLYRKVL